MKSVIEEGPSVAKAIENGWIKAGKPKEFSVKIFQEPKKNFLGITTTIAKVAIFFKDYLTQESRDRSIGQVDKEKQATQGYRDQRPQFKKDHYQKRDRFEKKYEPRRYQDRQDNKGDSQPYYKDKQERNKYHDKRNFKNRRPYRRDENTKNEDQQQQTIYDDKENKE